jgi:AraC-like DNA-binding protein
LYDRRLVANPMEWVRAWRPVVDGIHEVFHARFVDHVYPRHTHDAWTVFLVDQGAIAYDLERRHRGAAGSSVTLLPPHVVHDGRAATPNGFRKRVLYVGTELLSEALAGRAVDGPDIADPGLVRAVDRLHAILRDPGEALEAEVRTALVAERLWERLGEPATRSDVAERTLAEGLRDLLEAHGREPFTLRDASRFLHATPAHLIRSFTRAFGIPPHRYLVSWRIGQARRLLLAGAPIATAAVEAGFHDQAHLTRHFRRHVGTTPGRFASGRP